MGYACPACDTAHPDAEHLANHLAFTAILGSEDHEAWLADHAPEWGDLGPAELGAVVADHVPEEPFPELDDDGTHDHARFDDGPRGGDLFADERPPGTPSSGDRELDAEAREVLDEARRMTEEMLSERSEE